MAADTPHTLYRHRQEPGKVTQESVDEAVRLTMEASERKRKQREKEKEKEKAGGYSIDEIFAGKADVEKEEKE